MRVMVIIKANEDSEAGIMPSQRLLKEMGDFNDELVKTSSTSQTLHRAVSGERQRRGRSEET